MLFHTWTFLLFILVVLGVYFSLQRTRFWLPWLLFASFVFYGWWNPYYLILIVYSTALDYFVVAMLEGCPTDRTIRFRQCFQRFLGHHFENRAARLTYLSCSVAVLSGGVLVGVGPGTLQPLMAAMSIILLLIAIAALFESRRIWLWVSIVNNLSLLGFFKYADFFIANLNGILASARLTWRLPEAYALMPFGFEYLLPVGISFYTFQSMSYTIDYYHGRIHRERSLIRFATFVAFFPQLVAGPIERARNLLPQFYQFPKVTLQDITDGLSLFVVGLFKKLALANYISFYVERIYENPAQQNAPALMLATFAFGWQIYFDFSGYTDMARGVARLMGFRLMLNFNHPYLASSLSDFWSRWHISLSTWFRDYVYIPLGGNRRGHWLTYQNLFLTFLISGIWHGAAWTYVIWGGLHALGTMLTRELERSRWYRERAPRIAKQVGVFTFVCFAWIFFRAESLSDAVLIVTRIFTTGWSDPQMPILMLCLIGVVWLYQFVYESRYKEFLKIGWVRTTAVSAMIVWLFLFSSGGGEFIYFQF